MSDLKPTDYQLQLLRMSITHSDKEIARELGIREKTVQTNIAKAVRRLGASSRKAALRMMGANTAGVSSPIAEPLIVGTDGPVTADLHEGVGTTGIKTVFSLRRPSTTGIPTGWLIVLGAVATVLVLAGASALLTFFDTIGR